MNRYARKQSETGEYPNVLTKVYNAKLLIELHNTPCSIDDARAIIDSAVTQFNLEYLKKIQIDFTVTRGRAGSKSIQLPARLLTQKDIEQKNVLGKMRVGLVLHELAHTVHQTFRRRTYNQNVYPGKYIPHGPEYCMYLDALIGWYLGIYLKQIMAEELPIAAEAIQETQKQKQMRAYLSSSPIKYTAEQIDIAVLKVKE